MLIADDHPIVRQRLRQILAEGFPKAIVEEANDTTSLLTEALSNDWDIIISDLAMPGGGGLYALEKLKMAKPEVPFLIVSTYSEDQYAARAITSGAEAFINKDNADEQLVVKVREILERRREETGTPKDSL
jgi:DNA-binding NarL/FixJ family response regulator